MWKLFLALACAVFGLAGFWFYSEVSSEKERIEHFRRSWDTEVVGVIDSFNLIDGNAGVIYFEIQDIKGKRYDLSNYSGEPFYLLTNGKRGKLIEGSMRSIAKGDILMITSQKQFVILRNSQVVVTRPIYFSDVPVFWRKADMDKLENYWTW